MSITCNTISRSEDLDIFANGRNNASYIIALVDFDVEEDGVFPIFRVRASSDHLDEHLVRAVFGIGISSSSVANSVS